LLFSNERLEEFYKAYQIWEYSDIEEMFEGIDEFSEIELELDASVKEINLTTFVEMLRRLVEHK
jgi:hypothetical protein